MKYVLVIFAMYTQQVAVTTADINGRAECIAAANFLKTEAGKFYSMARVYAYCVPKGKDK